MNTMSNHLLVSVVAATMCAAAVTGCSVRSMPAGPGERVASGAVQVVAPQAPVRPLIQDRRRDDLPRTAPMDGLIPLRQLIEADRPAPEVPLRQLIEADRAETPPGAVTPSDRTVPLRQLIEADRPAPEVPLRQLMEADRAETGPHAATETRTVPLRQLIEADR
jgi:hypothetical protein